VQIHPNNLPTLVRFAHWCTIHVSVAEWLLMHPRCRRVTALLA
jgi:hypothetical protein